MASVRNIGLVTLALLQGLAEADLSVQCEANFNSALKRVGGYEEYKQCGSGCKCYAYEVLCLVRNDN